MGYFLEKFGIKILKEAEVDGQDVGNSNDQPSDYTDDTNQQVEPEGNVEQQPQENQTDDQNQEQPPVNDVPPEEQTTDYTAEDMEAGDPSTSEDGQYQGGNPPDNNSEEGQPVDDIKKQEEDLYSNLTPEQLDIKHKELKNQFLSMYDITTSIIERIGDANINEENVGIVEYISDNLSRMRTMLTDYIDSVYAGKSYIENSVNYNRFLAVLNGINKILELLDKKEDK